MVWGGETRGRRGELALGLGQGVMAGYRNVSERATGELGGVVELPLRGPQASDFCIVRATTCTVSVLHLLAENRTAYLQGGTQRGRCDCLNLKCYTRRAASLRAILCWMLLLHMHYHTLGKELRNAHRVQGGLRILRLTIRVNYLMPNHTFSSRFISSPLLPCERLSRRQTH
jgi:hypothetical protein